MRQHDARNRGWRRTAVLPLILLARFWQIGPSRVLPASCRFSPSCSAYAIQAWTIHGPVTGTWLTLRRIGRCNPWGGCGHDPVPPAPVPPVKDRTLV